MNATRTAGVTIGWTGTSRGQLPAERPHRHLSGLAEVATSEWPLQMKNNRAALYSGHRYPVAVIAHAVWLTFRFPLSLRMVEKMLAERGIMVSHETIRQGG